MELETPRLRLRPVCAGDLDAIAALGADPRVMDPRGGAMSRDATRGWLERLVAHCLDAGIARRTRSSR